MMSCLRVNKTQFIALALAFFTGSVPTALSAQLKDAEYYKLSVQNGLSSDFTYCIIRDSEGFYWIGTADGLSRFDGTSYKIFRHDRNDSNSLSHNSCYTLLEDRNGDIWVGTQKGVNHYQKKKGKFTRYYFKHPKFNDDIINPVYTLMEDRDGNIWISTYGLWKINPQTGETTSFTWHDKPNRLSDSTQTRNAEYDIDAHGIWFTTALQLNFFSIDRKEFFNTGNNPPGWKVFGLPEKNPFITADKKGLIRLYAELSKNLYTFRAEDNVLEQTFLPLYDKIERFTDDKSGKLLFRFISKPCRIYYSGSNTFDSLPALPELNIPADAALVYNIYTDPGGNFWLCTKKGAIVVRKPENYISIKKLELKDKKLPSARRVCVVNDSAIILGTGKGLFTYTPGANTPIPFNENDFHKSISAILNAGDSVLWVATSDDVILHYDIRRRIIRKKISMPTRTLFIMPDKYGSVWAGTWSEGLFEFDRKGNILRHYTEQNDFAHQGYFLGCYYDGEDELWMGLNGGNGFARLNVKTKKFSHYKIRSERKTDFPVNSINAVLKDKQNNIWLGTYGGGLYCFNQSTGAFKGFNHNDGLSGDFINSITNDSRGNIWISTSQGIDVFNSADSSFGHINTSIEHDNTGFVNNLYKYKENLYYISNGKLTVVSPEKFNGGRQQAATIISSVKISGKELNDKPGNTLTLNYNENFFTVEYSVLKVSPDIPAEYKYKLDGFDKGWNFPGRRGIANYTNVPPGKYVLLLLATNESGIWNTEPLRIFITIKPPFWKTWWFYLLAGLAVVSLLTAIVRYRLNQIKARQQKQLMLVVETQEKEKRNIAAQMHDDLGVRLSALKYFATSLKQFLQPGNRKAEEIYTKTISSIDESVEDIRYLLVNLSPKTLTEYGYLMAVEDLVNKLRRMHIIQVDLFQQGLEERLPAEMESGLYRITQELINNTLKHAQARAIKLHIERKDGNLQLNYSDDGKGFDEKQNSNGYGLENIHTRVTLLNGKIEWKQLSGKITGVSISIPCPHTRV